MSHNLYAEQLSAMLDGELPAAEMAPLTLHLVGCPDCAQRLAELAALRAALQQAFPEEDVSAADYAIIAELLDREVQTAGQSKVRAFRPRPARTLAWLAAGAAIAAMLFLLPHHGETKDLMSVRDAALRGAISRMVAVGTAAPVSGFRLVASRSDMVAGHPAQVLNYSKNDQTITLCIWAANGEPAHGVRKAIYKGFAISYWNDGHEEYWAASDGDTATLDNFVAIVKAS